MQEIRGGQQPSTRLMVMPTRNTINATRRAAVAKATGVDIDTARISRCTEQFFVSLSFVIQTHSSIADRPSALLFFAPEIQLTAGLHERFYRFIYACGVLVFFDGNDDAALIAPNGNDLQSRVLPFSDSFQKVLCVILLCDLRKAPLLYGLHRISINRRRVPVNQDRRGTSA